MTEEYVEIEGDVVQESDIRLSRSRGLVDLIASGRLNFVRLIDCKRTTCENENDVFFESVIFEVEIERPQRYVNDIGRIERIAACFSSLDNFYPEVFALRKSFPAVPHLNVKNIELPRSLCLYEQSWSEIVLRWTPSQFIERIRFWLTETAKGTLHQDDQPLEPVLLNSGWHILLPANLFNDLPSTQTETLQIGRATPKEDCRVLLTHPESEHGGTSVLAICIKTSPRDQTAISKLPLNLAELHDFLAQAGFDLRGKLRQAFGEVEQEHRNRNLLIVVAFPLLRNEQEQVEIHDVWAFLSKSIEEVGIAIGKWSKESGEGHLGEIIGNIDDTTGNDGSDILIDIAKPHFRLSRESAAKASSLSQEKCKTIAIGAGAIGSQVIRLLAQSGFGIWTIIDDDWFAPHNVARHVLSPVWIGWPKAEALTKELTILYPSEPQPTSFAEDFTKASQYNVDLIQAISFADLILDMSTSVSVARHLANDVKTSARCVSVFMNPSGTDLVILFEDAKRDLPLDCLEMQYYREVAFNKKLTDHLQEPTARNRYSRSCSDVSSTISTALVTLHSAIAAQELRILNQNKAAQAVIWQTSNSPIQIHPLIIDLTPVYRRKMGEWTLTVSRYVLDQLSRLRRNKLPNETGGVLIGSYDLLRKIVYVVDYLPSPPDSEEWPTLYIRGSRGLAKEVKRINTVTQGNLEYVGEWHSHPKGCSCLPSDDDLHVFSWLTEKMDDAGLPAIMTIVVEGVSRWYVGKMSKSDGWEITNE